MFSCFVFLGFMIYSCQCSSSEFQEFEGEYYGKADSPKEDEIAYSSLNQKHSFVSDVEETSEDLTNKTITVNSVEIPIISRDVAEQLIKRKAYTVSYNKDTKCPNWVAWYLTTSHADGEWARSNDYREDYDVPAPRATNDDYRGSSWSRGHMCPAGDNKWDADAMSETFLLSNMCPQDRGLNSGLWNRVETDCRKWAKKYGGVYIVCGPLYYDKVHEVIGYNKVVVPEAFFKVVLCLEGKPKAIGFVVKNNEGTKKKDQYVNSVDEVERLTGIDFFPALPDEIENEVEAKANLYEW
ncbi:endonuclease G [Xylanibacter ruminicola]|uniref:Endonuclease G n=2 Tax=Xylanibacter ruminicola TaxID=839 RepID=A0A1M6Z463_XYLRU|nr:endonuclease G [Xylanibacter ruminicola]